MAKPQDPEIRRDEQTAVADTNSEKERGMSGKAHGTDKGGKGGGSGSVPGDGRPAGQRPPYPS
jgi:hypothetical protein